MNILKDNGIFAFICSNKFAKAKYGGKLRKLILENQLKIYNDLTGINVFKEASVDTCVIQIKKDFVEDNEVYVDNKYYMKQERLNSKSFIFNTPEVLNLRDKIFKQGTMIKDLNIQINRGVLTGFNEAFIIDEDTKNRLIKEDSKNKEIIKPLLRGKDIKKWGIHYKNFYLIHSYNGLDTKNKYPSIYKFLSQYKEKLEKRYDKGENWYNLRSCSYDDLFEKEKIIYSAISPEPSFAYDDNNNYILNSGFILNSNSINIKYLIALLNSKLLFWYFKDICNSLSTKGFQYKEIFVEQLPIKTINKNMEKELCNLVNKILEFNKIFINETNFLWNYILKEFKVQKISNKLENYFKLNSEEFLKEIKKQNGVISNEFLKDALIQKFNFSCQKIEEIQLNIEYIEKELNKLIYLIYNLDENEINIVENELKKFNTF